MPRLTTVHKLTARTYDDPIAARREIERGLTCADVHPASLPAEAILFVRRIRLHRIGRLGHDLKSILESLASVAVRPIAEPGGQEAEAVRFSCEAEMLACLAIDWLAGSAQSRWWWPQVAGSLPLAASPTRIWLRSPEWIPAAMLYLARRNRAVSFAQALPPGERTALAEAMLQAHQVAFPVLPIASEEAVTGRADLPAVQQVYALPCVQYLGVDLMPRHAPPDTQLLVATALMLQCHPAVFREAGFQSALREWWQMANLPAPEADAPPARSESAAIVRSPAPPARFENAAIVRSPAPPESSGEMIASVSPASVMPVVSPAAAAQPESGVLYHTDLGGVMYLVNFAIFCGMYQDFTSPIEIEDRPTIWDALDRLARELPGADLPADDAIWTMLAELAGRDPALPSPDLGLSDSWRLLPELSLDLIRSWQELAALARTRLAMALDVLESETAVFLLRRSARIRVTLTHVTVCLPLDDVSLNVRVSGLDRDPGWVPSAGRSIRFVYE